MPPGVTPAPLQTPPAGVAPVTWKAGEFAHTVCLAPAIALLTAKSNLKAALLQFELLFVLDQALGVVGKALVPWHPAHTAWYTNPRLSKRLVPPSTCSAEDGSFPPKNVA